MVASSRASIKIQSASPGCYLDAWEFVPEGPKPPVVILGHGFSCVKSMGLGEFGEALAEKGYGAVAFDYRSFGLSDGQPRNMLSSSDQLQDYRSVISYIRRADSPFDPTRVAVWGFSFGGAHVTRLATDPGLGLVAAVAVAPPTNPLCTATWLSTLSILRVVCTSLADLARRKLLGGPPVYVRACSEPGELGALGVKGGPKDFAIAAANAPEWQDRVQAAVVWDVMTYLAALFPSSIRIPYLVVWCRQERYTPAWPAKWLATHAPHGEVAEVDGDHFDVFKPMRGHEAAIDAVCSFLERVMPL